ncbi:MAG: DEAD/DEAH box helicase family protein [Sulfurimonas sp.]
MRSADLVLFRDICDELDTNLYYSLQNPDEEFKEDVQSGVKFSEYASSSVEYDFDDMEDKLNVKLRYYQRIALYFTKYYFDKKYLIGENKNNKLTYWMATGSGKTVIMKANIIDYFEYLRDKNPDEIEVIITSPLKELIGQLQKEMSEFFTHPFFRDFKFSYKIETTQGLIENYKSESHEIVGDNQFRLLLVDEAHIGLGNDKSGMGAFVKIRNELTQNISNSFMFEYSATFYDVNKKDQIKEYANRIIYEYDYGKFYNDKYGKDFKFDVIKKDDIAEDEDKDIKRNLDVNLVAFKEKINAFNEFNSKFKAKPFPNRPLLIMAGNTVSKIAAKDQNGNTIKLKNGKDKTVSVEESSDIAKIIGYLAQLSSEEINGYLDIFNENKGVLHLLQNSSNNGELLMAYGEDAVPFGLITVGDVKKFLDNSNIQTLIENKKIISKAVKFTDENYLFKNIDFESSPINILIGSRKFSAGWNSFRASQICLINFGTGSGPTIIQMFGRGVRLRGLNDDGKRQERLYVKEDDSGKFEFANWDKSKIAQEKYEHLKYLETLFIYSLKSTYLSKFVEEDTDIYKKSINFTKEVKVSSDVSKKSLPVFKIDKSFSLDGKDIVVVVSQEEDKNNTKFLHISYAYDTKSDNTTIELPLNLNLMVQKEKTLEFKEYEPYIAFIDRSYLQQLLNKKLSKNSMNVEGLNVDILIEWLRAKFITIKYDGEVQSPKQIQKLFVKIVDTLVSKIKNKIIYNESKNSYIYDESIADEDLVQSYNVKFILQKDAKENEVRAELEKDDSYKIFIDKVVSHYYQPLALDPETKTKENYKSYQECLSPEFTENYESIKDFGEHKNYYKDIESIKVSPDKLDSFEFKFVCDLQKYINEHQLDATILRNKSKGNIGFSSNDGIYYPDFIIWYTDTQKQQHLIFCDPKGIRNSETEWKVCEAPYAIKELEKQWGSGIKLHSFIVSNTPKKDIKWSPIKNISPQECDVFFNLLFFTDEDYINKIFSGLDTDILLHKVFKKNLEHFDEEVTQEWLDDEKRDKHLKIIEKIQKDEKIDMEKAILLYFVIWNKQDRIKEQEAKDLKGEVVEQVFEAVIKDVIPEFALDTIPYSRTCLKIYKYLRT